MKVANQRTTTAKQRAGNRRPKGNGPYSRLLRNGTISGRTTAGRYLRAVEHELSQHVGGSPSVVQRMLIRRLANVALRLELFDKKLGLGGKATDYDAKVYGALHTSFRLLCREIGVKPAVAKPGAAFAEHIANLPQLESEDVA